MAFGRLIPFKKNNICLRQTQAPISWMIDFYINLSDSKKLFYIFRKIIITCLENRQRGKEVPEPVEGTFILMEMRHPMPELAEGSRTRMTLIQ